MALVVYQGGAGAESSQDDTFSDYYGTGSSNHANSTSTNTNTEGTKRFVGLANQGATW